MTILVRQSIARIGKIMRGRYTHGIHGFDEGFIMKRILLPFLMLSVMLLGLTACGQKGPLYHPDDEKAAHEHRKDRYEL
jgi:predicted small lipoprotein YifL